MNNKIAVNIFFLSLALFSTTTVQAFTVNGMELSSIIKPGEVLFYEDLSQDNICLVIDKNSLKMGPLLLEKAHDAANYFNYLLENKDKLYNQDCRDTITIPSSSNITVEGAYIASDVNIQLEATTDIKISDAILKANNVIFICNTIESKAFFLDADALHIQCTDPASPIKVIRFSLNKEITTPHGLESMFNFQEATGILLVVGAKKVEIVFDPALVS